MAQALPTTAYTGSFTPTYSTAGLGLDGSALDVSKIDPALMATVKSANAGQITQGLGAFVDPSAIFQNHTNGPNDNGPNLEYDNAVQGMKDLADQYGLKTDSSWDDPAGVVSNMYQLNDQLKNYFTIGGLSGGWDGSNSVSGSANRTLYMDNGNGQLVAVSAPQSYNADQKHGYFETGPGQDLLGAAAVIGGGYLAGTALSGLAAGTAGAAGAGTGGAASAGGTAAGGSGLTGGLSQSIANYLGLGDQWASLPAWGQSAISGAGQGALKSGLTGGNPLTGALMGGLSGGVSGGLSSGLSGLGLSSGLSSALGRLGGGLASGLAGTALAGSGSAAAGSAAASGGGSSPSLGNGLIGLGTSLSKSALASNPGTGSGQDSYQVGQGNALEQSALLKAMNTPGLAGDAVGAQKANLLRALQGAS